MKANNLKPSVTAARRELRDLEARVRNGFEVDKQRLYRLRGWMAARDLNNVSEYSPERDPLYWTMVIGVFADSVAIMAAGAKGTTVSRLRRWRSSTSTASRAAPIGNPVTSKFLRSMKITSLSDSALSDSAFAEFEPTTGRFFTEVGDDIDVEAVIVDELSTRYGFPVKVEIFHADGRAIGTICDETPSEGTFVATRLGAAVPVVVTRHRALLQLLSERGLIPAGARIVEHATADDVRGQDVIGILPMGLAALARSVTEIPLTLSPEDRGKELDIERLRQIAGNPVTYVVTRQR